MKQDDFEYGFADTLAGNRAFAHALADPDLSGYALEDLSGVTCMHAGARVTEDVVRTLVLDSYGFEVRYHANSRTPTFGAESCGG